MKDVLHRSLLSMRIRDEITMTERTYRKVQDRIQEFRRERKYHFMIKSEPGIKIVRRVA